MSNNQRVRVTKKMLKDSLIRLLKKENIHKLSVKEICEDAEINRSTFYKYYGSQYDLFEEMERDVLTQISGYLEGENTPGGSAQVVKTMTYVNDNIDLCRLLLNNNLNPKLPEKLISLQSFRHLISQRLDDRYSEDVLEYIYDFVIHGGFCVIRKWINKENRETPEEIAELLNITIMKALA